MTQSKRKEVTIGRSPAFRPAASVFDWRRWFGIALLAAGLFWSATAQAESGVTNTISGVIANYAGGYIVGTDGVFNALIVTNAGVVNVTGGNSIIGNSAGSSNNLAQISGAGSLWSNGSSLYVGYAGSGNTLTIANSGRVVNIDEYVGLQGGADNNSVLVTGSGSLWNTNTLVIGYNGNQNTLTIRDGGVVSNVWGNIGGYFRDSNSGGISNSVTVTGGTWINHGSLMIGNNGGSAFNSLTVSNSGYVLSAFGYIGLLSGNNSALVSGTGSVWTCGDDLFVGNGGSRNSLLVTNGGRVISWDGWIGWGGSSNSVLVSGSNSVWRNASGGGDLAIGPFGSFNTLTINDGGMVSNSVACVGGYYGNSSSAGSNNTAIVSGAGSTWSSSTILVGAYAGSAFNTLVITNGGLVSSDGGTVGWGGDRNSAVITGSNSLWTMCSDVYVGWYGGSNTLTVAAGGSVSNANGYVGYGASDNNVLVTGTASSWQNTGDLYVGYSGSGNTLTIASGGKVFNSIGYIGYDGSLGGSGNSVWVTDSGSLWSNTWDVVLGDAAGNGPSASSGNSLVVTNNGVVMAGGDLYVGYYGSSNTMTIAAGGKVFNGNGYIGYDGSLGGGGNLVWVTDSGSLWSNTWDVVLGDAAGNGPSASSGNSLVVTNNGVVIAGGNLYVGMYGSSNTMTIAGGGLVMDNNGCIGLSGNLGGGDNSVLVTGPGSLWSNTSDVIVGGYNGSGSPLSSGNRLVITNGGRVMAGGDLYVGMYGSSNTMTIANGGQVFSRDGYIGYDGSSGGGFNAVLVTGSGSLWSNAHDMVVGDYDGYSTSFSSGNRLAVANGGVVMVDSDLYVGYYGSSNSVTIADGGIAMAGGVVVGANPSTGNVLTVSGGSLYVTNVSGTGTLLVNYGTLTLNSGVVMADNFLVTNGTDSAVILNGGTLSAGTATVSNNTAFVIGDGTSTASLVLRSGVSSFANDIAVANNATLTVFNTVNVAGNFTQSAGGTLVVEFGGTSAGQYGCLNIAGTASLTGMVEAVGYNGFTPTNGMQIIFLHAAAGWTNHFSSFTNLTTSPSLTALTAYLIYPDADDVAVKWNYSFTSYAQTPNQLAVANALNAEVNNPAMSSLVNYLGGLPVSQLPEAFNSLSPQGLASMPQVGAGLANTQFGNLLSHFGTLRGSGGNGFNGGFSLFDPSGVMDWMDRQPRLASTLPMEQDLALTKEAMASGILRRSAENPWGVFVEGAGQFVGVDTSRGVNGYHVTSAGLTVGVDRQLLDATAFPHDQIVVGAALGYANSSTYLANNGRVDVNSVQGTLYGLWYKEGWHAEVAGGGGANIYDTKRHVLGQDATGNPQGYDLQGMMNGGYDWHLDEWIIGPRASVQYTTVNIDGFTESGSLAPLMIDSQNYDSLLSQIGIHVSRPFRVEKTLWIPDLSLGWQHESMDSVTSINAQFANGSGFVFPSQGVPLGRDSAVVGLGLTVQWSRNLSTCLAYSTELMRNNFSVQNVSAGVCFTF